MQAHSVGVEVNQVFTRMQPKYLADEDVPAGGFHLLRQSALESHRRLFNARRRHGTGGRRTQTHHSQFAHVRGQCFTTAMHLFCHRFVGDVDHKLAVCEDVGCSVLQVHILQLVDADEQDRGVFPHHVEHAEGRGVDHT